MEPSAVLRAGLATGDLIRYGAIIKDSTTGQIVGHLKETGLMESVLSSFFGAPQTLLKAANPLSFVADMGGHAANFHQIRAVGKSVEEVKALVEGLQLATNIAAFSSVASLGVSAAGFAYTANKLNAIEGKLDDLASGVAVIKSTLDTLSINWSAMTEARFRAAADALVLAESAESAERRTQLANEAATKFRELRHFYSQLLRQRGLLVDNELDIDTVWEITSRYTLSCLGLLRAEFILGDLGTYRGALKSVMEEYPSLVTFDAREVYLARCDKLAPLNLAIDHQDLSRSLINLSLTNSENVARIESHRVELDFIEKHQLTVDRYLGDLRAHESDVVLLRR
jgi:hypothetical protein